MSVNVWNFEKFDGIAKTKEQGDFELRIYLKGNTNALATILTRVIENKVPTFYLYNFISDKEHLRNLSKNNINALSPIEEIILFQEKISSEAKELINYALKNKIKITLQSKPF